MVLHIVRCCVFAANLCIFEMCNYFAVAAVCFAAHY